MSSMGSSEDILQQVNQFWSMLDDLSQTDQNAYQRFIEQQMKKGAESMSQPELHSCLHTEIITEPKQRLLHINVCAWRRVPAPQDPSKPTPMCGGKLERITEGKDCYSVLDVALNPAVLDQCQEHRAMDKVYMLALSFAQKQHGLKLSQRYTVTGSSLKGSLEDVRRRLGVWQPSKWSSAPRSTQPDTATQTPASLLQQISSLREEGREESSLAAELIAGPAHVDDQKTTLIEVISSCSITEQPPSELEHQLRVKTDSEGCRRIVELMVELPNVCSMSECHLTISQDDVLLEVKGLQCLLVELPEKVNEETASATFHKKKRRLTLTVDVQ